MNLRQRLMVAAVAGALGCAGTAAAMTKAETKAEKDRIEADFKAGKAKCDGFRSNAKDICMAEAKGANKIAKAEFEARQQDTPKARYNVQVAKAEAAYGIATEKCDDLSGNSKDVCIKDAKAALTRAKADAKVDMEARNANHAAGERVADARRDAAEDKRDANYAAAKARCDKFTGEVKDRCVADAKAQFNVK